MEEEEKQVVGKINCSRLVFFSSNSLRGKALTTGGNQVQGKNVNSALNWQQPQEQLRANVPSRAQLGEGRPYVRLCPHQTPNSAITTQNRSWHHRWGAEMGPNSQWGSKGCAAPAHTVMERKSLPCLSAYFLSKDHQKHPPWMPKNILPVPSTFSSSTHPTQTHSTGLSSTGLSPSTTLQLQFPTGDENSGADSNRISQVTSGIPRSTNTKLWAGPDGIPMGDPQEPSTSIRKELCTASMLLWLLEGLLGFFFLPLLKRILISLT